MSNDDPLKNWQLENQGESPEQWKLLDTEQEVGKHMQLQPAEVSGPQWQPVEYRREAWPSRNWVLPSIVIVALLAVLGYVGWIAFGQMGGVLPDVGALVEALTGQPLPGSADTAPVATPTEEDRCRRRHGGAVDADGLTDGTAHSRAYRHVLRPNQPRSPWLSW